MIFKVKFCVFLLALSTVTAEKVKVTVFYETHCPCSISFFKKQLYPNYFNLNESLVLDLVPYGNTKNISKGAVLDFECKKGCRSMKIHACTIDAPISLDTTMHFLNCLIDGSYSDIEVQLCGKIFDIPLDKIEKCVSNEASNQLLDKFGKLTEKIGSVHIPAISFNGKYADDASQRARENFLETTCDAYTKQPPKICTKASKELKQNDL